MNLYRAKYFLIVLLAMLIAAVVLAALPPAQAQDLDATQATREVVREFNQLGGLAEAVAGAGDLLAAGIGRRVVMFDFTGANRLATVGRSVPLAGDVLSIVVNGPIAYVAAGDGGLYALDISNPRAPKVLWHDSNHARQLHIQEDILYAAAGSGGLTLFDLAHAEQPQLISRFPTPGEYLRAVDVMGGIAYTVGSNKLLLVDISYPKKPALAGEYIGPGPYAIRDVAVDAERAFLSVDGEGLIALSVANPAAPVEIGRHDAISHAGAIYLHNDLAIVSDDESSGEGLHVLEIEDATNIRQVGLKNGLYFKDASQFGDSLAMASAEEGINLLSLKLLPQVRHTHAADANSFTRIVAGDGVLAAGTPDDNLQLFDASNPFDPQMKGSLSMGDYIADIAISGSIVFVSIDDGVHVVDISNQTMPREVALIPIQYPFEVMIRGKWAYVASSDDGLAVVDISNPRQPQIVGSLNRYADAAAMGDKYVYLLERPSNPGQTQKTVHVISVANPARPRILGSLPSNIWDMAAVGKIVYGGAGGQITIIDTSDPAAPVETGTMAGYAPYAYQNRLYVTRNNKVEVYDISQNPLAPELEHSFDPHGDISGIVAKDQFLYLTNYRSGLSTRMWVEADSTQIGWQDSTLHSADNKVTYHLPKTIAEGFATFYHWRQPLDSLVNYPQLLPTNILFANQAKGFSGAMIPPAGPYQLEIFFDTNDLDLVQESSLQLLHFNGADWEVEQSAQIDFASNKVTAEPESFGVWLLAGTAEYQSFLPYISSRTAQSDLDN